MTLIIEKPILVVDHLEVFIKQKNSKTELVKDISFDLHKNEVLGIVGESGSGKSLTSLAIMGLLGKPLNLNANKLEILTASSPTNVDLLQLSKKGYNKIRGNEISMIFQEPMTALNPAFKCGNQIIEAVLQHNKVSEKEAKTITLKWLERVKIPDPNKAYNSYPHELSGGQRQRVMIAMAMSCNPSILIADEPTTALDVTVQKSILLLMKELQLEFGMGIIFISHDLGVIKDISDRVLVMNKGEVVEFGKTSGVLGNPLHPYTKGLLACKPPLVKKLKRLPVMKDFISNDAKESGQKSIESILKDLEIDNEAPLDKHEKETLLSAKNINVQYPIKFNLFGKPTGFFNAVKNVSISLNRGETLGLVGESGCGKTSLGRSILNLIEHGRGEIQFEGKLVNMNNKLERQNFRRKIQLIFQDPFSSLNPKITVGKAILEPMIVHHKHQSKHDLKNKVMHLLTQVGLTEEAYAKYPHEFSGGQRQRVGIARALALEPEIIICDESVSALDMSVQAQVLNLLNELKKKYQLTYLFISHDLSVVKYMSDRLIVMKDGIIEEEGISDEIYSNPKTEYTKKLINSIPGMNGS